jgi:hypothetical protein
MIQYFPHQLNHSPSNQSHTHQVVYSKHHKIQDAPSKRDFFNNHYLNPKSHPATKRIMRAFLHAGDLSIATLKTKGKSNLTYSIQLTQVHRVYKTSCAQKQKYFMGIPNHFRRQRRLLKNRNNESIYSKRKEKNPAPSIFQPDTTKERKERG